MAVLAVLATALKGVGTPAKGLYIDGLDVLKQPGSPGGLFGVPIETIEVVECGPGQVSSISFELDDPAGTVTLGQGQEVRYVDHAKNVPLFRGWTDAPITTPRSIGRRHRVTATGIEAALDWMMVPAQTLVTGTGAYVAVQSVVGQAMSFGFAPLTTSDGQPTQQDHPTSLGIGVTLGYDVVLQTCTLRQALTAIANALMVRWDGSAITGIRWTIDFWGGLRAWYMRGSINTDIGFGTDFIRLVVAAPTRTPANLRHEPSVGDGVHQVYVDSSTAAGRGLVSDGSGLPGAVALLRDDSSVNGASRLAIGRQYLSLHGEESRGEVTLEENTDVGTLGSEYRAGTIINITDAQVGLSAFLASINKITKRFHPSGTETWTVQYGAEVPSGANYLRRLTRGTLS